MQSFLLLKVTKPNAMPRKIINLSNTSHKKCKCGSWINHWQEFSGKNKPVYCSVDGCGGTDLVGAHVQIHKSTDANHYIVPLCKFHNSQYNEVLYILSSRVLVPANISKTCG